MIGSLFAGISGLNANATAMTVVGDNIANVNTTAFKSNRSSFANILSQSLGGSGGNDIGRGVDFWGTTPMWSQGSLENTSSPTDLAINGRGFFMLNDANGGRFYSRAGEFNFDRNGDLRNPDGLVVQGYPVTGVAPDGTLSENGWVDLSLKGDNLLLYRSEEIRLGGRRQLHPVEAGLAGVFPHRRCRRPLPTV